MLKLAGGRILRHIDEKLRYCDEKQPPVLFPFHTDVASTITDSPACAARDSQPILSQFAR